MSRGKGHVPMRTCVVCGAKRGKGELARFVLGQDEEWIRDASGRCAGRGVYACKTSSCMQALVNRKPAERVRRIRRPKRPRAEGS